MSSRRCWVPNCMNSQPKAAMQTRLFAFPRNVKKCREWLKAIGDPVLAQCSWGSLTSCKYVCKDHFLSIHITPSDRTTEAAVPQIFNELRARLPDSSLKMFDESVPEDRKIRENKAAAAFLAEEVGSNADDSWGMDHDYIATTISKEIRIQECAELNEENVSCYPVLEDVRKELCRLCGQKESLLIPIFETSSTDTTQEIAFSLKVEMYLPFKIKVDDPLPSHICSNCYNIVNQWHELYVCCVAADAALWKAFGTESEKSTRNHPDAHITRVKEEGLQVQSISPEINAMEPLVIVTEAKEQDVNCSECGKNKILSISVEEELFDNELDKTFANIRSISSKCSFCYELFKSSSDRKNHMAMCRQLSTICEVCGHKVPRRKDLPAHKYQKHKTKNIQQKNKCHICDKCFKTAAALRYHIECVHEKNLTPQYHCERCCCAFVGEQSYRLHQKKHEKGLIKTVFQMEAFLENGNSQPDVYSCPVCQETFNDMLSLIIHLTTKKKMKCSVCLKVMSSEKHLMVHVCGQWTCQYCLKTFDQKVKWIVHERLHTGEKPFKCRRCDLTFRSYHSRRNHEEHHDPAYQCYYCGKSFRMKCVFRDHILGHEGEVFSCHICDKKLSGKRGLWKHNNRFHKNITIPS